MDPTSVPSALHPRFQVRPGRRQQEDSRAVSQAPRGAVQLPGLSLVLFKPRTRAAHQLRKQQHNKITLPLLSFISRRSFAKLSSLNSRSPVSSHCTYLQKRTRRARKVYAMPRVAK